MVVRLIMVIIFQCVKILNHHCTPETNNIVSQLHFSIKKPLTKNKHKYSHTTLHLWISLHLTKPFHIHHHIWAWPEPCKVVTSSKGTAKSLQSCPTLCDPKDDSPPGSPVPGILQARTLEWVAISFSNAWKWKVKVKSLSRVRLLLTPWTAAHQAPLSMGFSRQEYWSGVPLPSPSKGTERSKTTQFQRQMGVLTKKL